MRHQGRFIDAWIRAVRNHQKKEVVIPIVMTGYRKLAVSEYVKQHLSDAHIFNAPCMGTGGSIAFYWDAIIQFRPEIIMVSPADHRHSINYHQLISHHVATKADMTLVCVNKHGEPHDYIRERNGQLSLERGGSGEAFTGVAVFSTLCLKQLIANIRVPADLTTEMIKPLLAQGVHATLYRETGPWEDLGTWKHYLKQLCNKEMGR